MPSGYTAVCPFLLQSFPTGRFVRFQEGVRHHRLTVFFSPHTPIIILGSFSIVFPRILLPLFPNFLVRTLPLTHMSHLHPGSPPPGGESSAESLPPRPPHFQLISSVIPPLCPPSVWLTGPLYNCTSCENKDICSHRLTKSRCPSPQQSHYLPPASHSSFQEPVWDVAACPTPMSSLANPQALIARGLSHCSPSSFAPTSPLF